MVPKPWRKSKPVGKYTDVWVRKSPVGKYVIVADIDKPFFTTAFCPKGSKEGFNLADADTLADAIQFCEHHIESVLDLELGTQLLMDAQR